MAKHRAWTKEELLLLLDPSITIREITQKLGTSRGRVNAELKRMRSHGIAVPQRRRPALIHRGPLGPQRRLAERDAAIIEAIKSGKTQGEVAETFGLTQPRIAQIWQQSDPDDGVIDSAPIRWNPFEISVLISHAGRTHHEIADLLGRTPLAVERMRDRLVKGGVIPRNRVHPDVVIRNRAIAVAWTRGESVDEIALRWDLSIEAVRAALKTDEETQRLYKYNVINGEMP